MAHTGGLVHKLGVAMNGSLAQNQVYALQGWVGGYDFEYMECFNNFEPINTVRILLMSHRLFLGHSLIHPPTQHPLVAAYLTSYLNLDQGSVKKNQSQYQNIKTKTQTNTNTNNQKPGTKH